MSCPNQEKWHYHQIQHTEIILVTNSHLNQIVFNFLGQPQAKGFPSKAWQMNITIKSRILKINLVAKFPLKQTYLSFWTNCHQNMYISMTNEHYHPIQHIGIILATTSHFNQICPKYVHICPKSVFLSKSGQMNITIEYSIWVSTFMWRS